jgi:hypothetical protein
MAASLRTFGRLSRTIGKIHSRGQEQFPPRIERKTRKRKRRKAEQWRNVSTVVEDRFSGPHFDLDEIEKWDTGDPW